MLSHQLRRQSTSKFTAKDVADLSRKTTEFFQHHKVYIGGAGFACFAISYSVAQKFAADLHADLLDLKNDLRDFKIEIRDMLQQINQQQHQGSGSIPLNNYDAPGGDSNTTGGDSDAPAAGSPVPE
ncbi:MAG: hypothetical protein MHM6MM_006031 [Cercozoa sp. M6MM]